MKNLFPIAVCALMASGAHAQSPAASGADTAATAGSKSFKFQRYEWDASIDASFVLPTTYQVNGWGYYGYPYGYGYGYASPFANNGFASTNRSTRFLLRRNNYSGAASGASLRQGARRFIFSLGGGNTRAKTDTVRINTTANWYIPTRSNSLSVGAGLGYEWQHQAGRFQFFYGCDVLVGAGFSNESGEVFSTVMEEDEASMKSSYLNAGVAPLAGVKFFVHPRFSLSLESAYTIFYRRSRTEASDNLPGTFLRSGRESSLTYNLVPLSAFNATFHFGKVVKP